MTIDEAIDYIEDINATVGWTKDQVKDADFFLNVGKWLEELQELRKFKEDFADLGKFYSEIRLEERNKAIDDFVNICLEHKSKDEYPIMCFDEFTIKRFAEQLKKGAD